MPTALPTAALGAHTVSRIGFGAMQLAGAQVPRATALAVVRRAVELGVTHVDTAQFYGGGHTNLLLREALELPRSGVVVATKVGAVHEPGLGLVPAQRPEELRAQVHANLRSLGVQQLDVVNLRRVDRAPGIVAEGEQVVDLDDQLAELVALREQGLVGAIGLSAVTVAQLRLALQAGIVCVQNLYNLVEREAEPLLELCAEHGIAWVPFFPVGSGFEGRARPVDEPRVREVARELNTTPHAVCLAWLLAHDRHVLLIPGTADVGHLEANVAAGDLTLPADALARLDALR